MEIVRRPTRSESDSLHDESGVDYVLAHRGQGKKSCTITKRTASFMSIQSSRYGKALVSHRPIAGDQ